MTKEDELKGEKLMDWLYWKKTEDNFLDSHTLEAAIKYIDLLKKENKIMLDVVKHYASIENWSGLQSDGGRVARTVLTVLNYEGRM